MHTTYGNENVTDFDFTEYCPNCDTDIAIKIDPDDPSYETVCPVCGKKLMLCLLCHDDFGDNCDWCPEHGCSRQKDRMEKETYTYETYPPMFSDYENDIENENYDHELRMFTVPAYWAIKWMREEAEMTKAWFDCQYTWDDTFSMYEAACREGVILKEWIEERDW